MASSYTWQLAGVDRFSENRAEWNRLVEAMDFPSPFLTWEWTFSWWEHFRGRRSPVVLFFLRDGELRGILPLFREACPGPLALMRGPCLGFMGYPEVFPDHLDIIAAREDLGPCLDALRDFLAGNNPAWVRLRLPLVSEESAIATRSVEKLKAFSMMASRASVAPFVATTSTFEAFLSEFPAKQRYKITNPGKRLFARGAHYVTYDRASWGGALERLVDLHAKRARQKGIVSTFDVTAVQRFHHSFLGRAKSSDVVLRGLEIDGTVIAVLYALRCCDRMFFFQQGYDAQWAQDSPGVAIVTEVLREAFTSGCREFNFLQGDEGYKRLWTGRSRALYNYDVYNKTLRGLTALHADRAKRRLKSWVYRAASRAKSEI